MTNRTVYTLFLCILSCIIRTNNATFVSNGNMRIIKQKREHSKLSESKSNNFDFEARIESAKSGICGLLAGGFALAPFSAAHNLIIGGDNVVNGLAQWEFDTDMGSLEGALFAIVVRMIILSLDLSFSLIFNPQSV